MPFPRSRVFLIAFVPFFAASLALAQTAAQTSSSPAPATAPASKQPDDLALIPRLLAEEEAASTTGDGTPGIVPIRKGFNGSLETTSQHDSAGGWTNILTPNIAYRFNRHFSINAGLPVYTYIDVAVPVSEVVELGVPISVTYGLQTRTWLLGDTDINGEFEVHPKAFDYYLTGTLAVPTGDNANALGAGQPTYYFNNRFERVVKDMMVPHLELGIGDSLNLANTRIHDSYIEVGTNAHFQLGTSVWLPWNTTFTSAAYEDLPLATQTVTSVTTNGKKGKQLKLITTTTQESLGEDNGFLNTLDIPLNSRITLSGIYNRSLRNKNDTVGFSFTFTLRSDTPWKKTAP